MNQLQKQLDGVQRELNLEKGRSAHLKSELKKYQSSLLRNKTGVESILRCWMFGEDLASAYVLRHWTPTVLEFRTRVWKFGL